MPANTGTLTIQDLLAVQHQSAIEFGLDTIQQVLEADIAAHNAIVQDMIGTLCEFTTDRQRIYGASQDGELQEVDELGRPQAHQPQPGSEVGFPLRKFMRALGWTSTYFKIATPEDIARAVLGIEKAHLKALQTQIKYAIFRTTNYSYKDHLVDDFVLSIKRLANADSQNIPEGPNGESFNPATHTHYTAAAALANADLIALIDNVVEHGHGDSVMLSINRTNESAVRALNDFEPYPDPRLVLGTHVNQHSQRLDISRLDNRAIGTFGAAEVWVKSWNPAGYAFCTDTGSAEKPLVFRQREQTSLQGLRVVAENDFYPLIAQQMEAEFGIAVWNRTNGAVHQFTNATYQNPF